MYTGKTKKFKDTIHGYIEIPDIIVSNIIDTELFQRLHRVEQTSMRPLYPAARHDRFIHSLGVYWLGKEVFHKFRNNAINELKKDELVNDEFVNDYAWWDKQEILFTLACLLHDCAHAPFSHTLESLYTLRKTTVDKDIANQSKASVGERIADLDYRLIKICTSENIFDKDFPKDFLVEREDESEIKGVGSPHEKMSAYCAMKEYKQAIENIIVQMNKESSNKITLEKSDFVFIVRMIIGCTYSESSLCNSIKNCIISMLNSPAIDVDGLDYIVRDAYMSGIDSFNIDYQRLLSSFTIIPVDVYKNKYVGESETDNLNGTWLKDSIFLLTKMEDDKGSKTIKTGEINAEEIKGKIIIENIEYDEKENIISLGEKVEIEGRTYKTKSGARTKCDALQSGKITFVESCDVKKSRFKGEIIQGKRIVSQISPSRIDGAEREYILGYSKNSLSIIQSTVEARNYEYMWVYTHPKVLYNSNYLQWELVRDSAKYLCCCENNKDFNKKKLTMNCLNCKFYKEKYEEYLLYIMGYDTFLDKGEMISVINKNKKLKDKGFVFYRSNDDDINALFKRIYIENSLREDKKNAQLEKDFYEYFSRNQRRPLWKSFVEYENFIKSYMEKGTQTTFRKICKTVVSNADKNTNDYNYFGNEQQKILDDYSIKNALVIKSKLKTKELKPSETYIKFNDQVLNLADIFEEESTKGKISREFYYIFADLDGEIEKDKFGELVDKLKESYGF